ncbi:MAG: ethanolamine ammonia-lyase subunit EutC [Methylococcaceae bacterium]|jgi:ethanolamine ammonia-lyase small subunit
MTLKPQDPTIHADPWLSLKQYTPARIALGHTGASLPTAASLNFQLAHALARDAVNIALDFTALSQLLSPLNLPLLTLQSRADNQRMYLQRPDLGRLLNAASLQQISASLTPQNPDAVIVVADGLSSKAIEHHAGAFLKLLVPELLARNYQISPLCLVKHARVAVGDAIAEAYTARLCIVLIGERPGLSSPDSMGIYFTYQAKSGLTTDADRNCISNIHNNGLDYPNALKKLLFLLAEAEKLQLSGVHLKDGTSQMAVSQQAQENVFLLV